MNNLLIKVLSYFVKARPLIIISLLTGCGNFLPLYLEPSALPTSVAAFPGAEGFGAATPGGRAGRVIEVTSLNDDGPGTLRAAIDTPGPRLVVFRVGGIIEITQPLRISEPYLTIAGQTAPGGGITLKGTDAGQGKMVVIQDTHDIVIRYLRIRSGAHGEPGHGQVNIQVGSGAHDVMIDHVSLSWTLDENLDIHRNIPEEADPDSWPQIYNVTVQQAIIAEGLYPHSTGARTGGEFEVAGWKGVYDISLHHNLFVNNSHRNPAMGGQTGQVINNVIYNWGSKAAESTSASMVDWIGNYFKPGSLSDATRLIVHNSFHPETPEQLWPDPSIYMSGNVSPPNFSTSEADNWAMYRVHYKEEPLPDNFRRDQPLPDSAIPVTIQLAYEAYNSVTTDVGANARLDCLGNWISNSDAVDTRLLANVINGTPQRGVPEPRFEDDPEYYGTHITNENQVGGYAPIAPGSPCTDTDHDGMPDAWEIATGILNPQVEDSSGYDLDSNYTNLEVYLNGPENYPMLLKFLLLSSDIIK